MAPLPYLTDNCAAGAGAAEIVTVDIAAGKAIATTRRVTETESLSLLEARGRVAASFIGSPLDLPPFDNSAMDGYAVASDDFDGAGPWKFRVEGRVAAGETGSRRSVKGSATRIFTGAPLPKGFDTVVMQEFCERSGDEITLKRRALRGENVRRAAEDVQQGSILIEEGEELSPQKLALLAGAGIAQALVYRKVRVALLSTGDELREPGMTLQPGQIYNSNRILLRSMLEAFPWADVLDVGIIPDNRELLKEVLAKLAQDADVIVTTGGVSAGEEDHIASIMRDDGAVLDVMKVAMRPGKPVKIGLCGGALLAALPGNPNAALVTFRQIALPAIRSAAGLRRVRPMFHPARAGFSYSKKAGRTEFVPVRIVSRDPAGIPVIDMIGRGSSASLSSIALADGIAILPADVESIEPSMSLVFEFLH